MAQTPLLTAVVPCAILRFIVQALSVMMIAAGTLATLGAGFTIATLAYIWDTEGALQAAEKDVMHGALLWLGGSLPVVVGGWWLYRRTVRDKAADQTFRLQHSPDGRTEKIVQWFSIGPLVAYAGARLLMGRDASLFSCFVNLTGGILAVFLALHLRILLHELAHLGAAAAMRFRLVEMQIGDGPSIWCHSFRNGLRWEWRLWPGGGWVRSLPRSNSRICLRYSLVVAAGPLSDVSILGGVLWAVKDHFGSIAGLLIAPHGPAVAIMYSCMVASTVAALVPHQLTLGTKRLCSDGYLLMRLLLFRGHGVTDFDPAYDPAEALKLLPAGQRPLHSEPKDGGESAGEIGIADFQQLRAPFDSSLLPRRLRHVSRPAP